MRLRLRCLFLVLFCLLAFPYRSPAPLIYTPGEGWTYEPVGGGGKWQRTRAKDQLEVAQTAFDKKDFGLAAKAARRVLVVWPVSDSAPRAEYILARCYEQKKKDEKAFNEYQKLLEKYPKGATYDYNEVLKREFEICTRFLHGEWFKIWGVIPAFPSMDRTAGMYEKLIKNGPYSDVAVQSQMNIGAAREKQWALMGDRQPYIDAAKAYERAADRYHDRPTVAADALFKAAQAYNKQAQTAEYDQGTSGQAIDTYTYFMSLFPNDPRVPEAEKTIAALKSEQAHGNFQTARFYEKTHHWRSALIYYNEVLIKDPKSPYAAPALKRITALKQLTQAAETPATPPATPPVK